MRFPFFPVKMKQTLLRSAGVVLLFGLAPGPAVLTGATASGDVGSQVRGHDRGLDSASKVSAVNSDKDKQGETRGFVSVGVVVAKVAAVGSD